MVTAIGEDAFRDNNGLREITIPSTITSIGDHAFAGCVNLEAIYVLAEMPVTLSQARTRSEGISVFDGVNMETCILYVPDGSVEKYKSANVWKDFKHIMPISSIGIMNLYAKDKPFDIYDIKGVKLRNAVNSLEGLPAGTYIIDGKKIVVVRGT